MILFIDQNKWICRVFGDLLAPWQLISVFFDMMLGHRYTKDDSGGQISSHSGVNDEIVPAEQNVSYWFLMSREENIELYSQEIFLEGFSVMENPPGFSWNYLTSVTALQTLCYRSLKLKSSTFFMIVSSSKIIWSSILYVWVLFSLSISWLICTNILSVMLVHLLIIEATFDISVDIPTTIPRSCYKSCVWQYTCTIWWPKMINACNSIHFNPH